MIYRERMEEESYMFRLSLFVLRAWVRGYRLCGRNCCALYLGVLQYMYRNKEK